MLRSAPPHSGDESFYSVLVARPAQGKYDEAIELYKKAIRIHLKAYGPDSAVVATDYGSLAGVYQQQGNLDEAEPLFEQAHRIKAKVYGMDHPNTANSFAWLAELKKSRVSTVALGAPVTFVRRTQALASLAMHHLVWVIGEVHHASLFWQNGSSLYTSACAVAATCRRAN